MTEHNTGDVQGTPMPSSGDVWTFIGVYSTQLYLAGYYSDRDLYLCRRLDDRSSLVRVGYVTVDGDVYRDPQALITGSYDQGRANKVGWVTSQGELYWNSKRFGVPVSDIPRRARDTFRIGGRVTGSGDFFVRGAAALLCLIPSLEGSI